MQYMKSILSRLNEIFTLDKIGFIFITKINERCDIK